MRIGLIGEHISYSLSPELHALLGGGYAYDILDTGAASLGTLLRGRTEYEGFNVTVPHKRAVIPFLDGLTPLAGRLGSVNTVLRCGDKLIGGNTDYAGFLSLMRHAGISPAGEKVLVIGGRGGAGRAVCAALLDSGAREVIALTRGPENVNERTALLSNAPSEHGDAGLIVNAAPCGTRPDYGIYPLDPQAFPALKGVLDLVYDPLRTAFVWRAEKAGVPAAGGLWMLVAQAALSREAFLGRKDAFSFDAGTLPEEAAIDGVCRALTEKRMHTVLIGMPGAGKTTVGRALAREKGMPFIDLDEEIEKRFGRTSAEIILTEGEAAFRQREADVAVSVAAGPRAVIAAGGGTVLTPRAMEALRANGHCIWVQRATERLATQGRPLSQNVEALTALYEKRAPLYALYADEILKND